MAEFTRQEMQQAYATALNNWSSPAKLFTSGFDPRSSDNALLALIYGGVVPCQRTRVVKRRQAPD